MPVPILRMGAQVWDLSLRLRVARKHLPNLNVYFSPGPAGGSPNTYETSKHLPQALGIGPKHLQNTHVENTPIHEMVTFVTTKLPVVQWRVRRKKRDFRASKRLQQPVT